MTTKVHYISVYKLQAVNSLPGQGSGIELATFAKPSFKALLTGDPEPHFVHIDRAHAVLAQWAKGGVAQWTIEGQLAAEIAGVKKERASATSEGVFVAFEGDTEIPNLTFKARRDTDQFGFSLDDVSKADIRDEFEPAVHCVLIALILSFSGRAVGFDKIGEVIYLTEAGSTKPIYVFNVEGGHARLYISRPMSSGHIEDARALAQRLISDKDLPRAFSLLRTSLDRATDELQGFMAAWNAMEIFINATFKSTYEVQWSQIIEKGASLSAKPVVERIAQVMNDKYRLADKFLIIASILDPDRAATDQKEFRRLKKVRDGLLHVLDMPAEPLPIEAAQSLLLKFMGLHLRAPSR
jgi:hypothetical protein